MIGPAESLWCLIIAGLAFVTDLKSHRIRNWTVVLGLVGGLLLNAADIRQTFLGCILPLLLFPFFCLNMMGAGDIKLLCALGAIVCYPNIILLTLWSFVFCGIFILIYALKMRGLGSLFNDIWQDIRFLFFTHKLSHNFTVGARLPMAGPIAAAALLIVTKNMINL